MSFFHLSLLTLGGLFMTVPIVLHLAMKQKPRHQVFPAIRFLQSRETTNKRKLRLRQWLLLALRCLVVLLLALALARPSVSSAVMGQWLVLGTLLGLLLVLLAITAAAIVYRRGVAILSVLAVLNLILAAAIVHSLIAVSRGDAPTLLGQRQAPVAAVLLIDNSVTMMYRYQNQSSLERAKEVARWLVRQFPKDSDVAVVDDRTGATAYCVDLGAAVKAIDAVQVSCQPSSWSRLLDESLALLTQSGRERKELYILSDMTQKTWGDLRSLDFQERLEAASEVSVQLIDVGVEDPQNNAVERMSLAQETIAAGSTVELSVDVLRIGSPITATLKLVVENVDARDPIIVDGQLELPATTVRDKKTIELEANLPQQVSFSLASLPHGTHHGYVEVDGEDGLDIDNRQYFSVHVRAPWPVLIAAPRGVITDFLSKALAPLEFRQASFECTVIDMSDLENHALPDFAAVALLDPTPINDAQWSALRRYVEQGGGLAVFLGGKALSATRFNSPAAQSVLPAAIERVWRDDDGLMLDPRDFNHPIVAPFSDIRSTVPWHEMRVFRHWAVADVAADAQILIPFSNRHPALLERRLGEGRVVLMTTPVSDASTGPTDPWNLIPTSEQPWPFLILVDRLFRHLAQSRDSSLNYEVGQVAHLSVPSQGSQRWPLLTPRGDWQEVASSGGEVRVTILDYPGTYRLKANVSGDEPTGFSANLSPEATRLSRINPEQLTDQLGEGRFRWARNKDQIEREIDQARIGREFYPFLLPVLVIVLAAEYVLANRFYRN